MLLMELQVLQCVVKSLTVLAQGHNDAIHPRANDTWLNVPFSVGENGGYEMT